MSQMVGCCVSGIRTGHHFGGHGYSHRNSRSNHDDASDNNPLATLSGCKSKSEYAAEIFDADQFRGEHVRHTHRIYATAWHDFPPSGLIPVMEGCIDLRASAMMRNLINDSNQPFSGVFHGFLTVREAFGDVA